MNSSQLDPAQIAPAARKLGWTPARYEGLLSVVVNVLVSLPAVVVAYGAQALSINRLEQPTDALDAGQASFFIALFLLGGVIGGGIAICQFKHSSPGAVVIRAGKRTRAALLLGILGLNVATLLGTVLTYRALATDYPNPPVLGVADLRVVLWRTGIEQSALPPDTVPVGTPDESGGYRLEVTGEGGFIAVGTVDGLPKGVLTFRVKKSVDEAKSVSRTWIGADGEFPIPGILYPSVCVERVDESQNACMIRVGQTIVMVDLYHTTAGDEHDRWMTVALAQAAVAHMEMVLDSAAPAR